MIDQQHTLLQKPEPPSPNECCENGCEPCVWDVYREDLLKWKAAHQTQSLSTNSLMTKPQLNQQLNDLNAKAGDPWIIDQEALLKTFSFDNFSQAMQFMQVVAQQAEKLDHHPDWSNRYNKVSVSLTTHSEGGLTRLDFDLAKFMEASASNI